MSRPGRRGRATIEDVAKLAGVSRQTVSRAVNDMAEITPSTKQRVLEAVRTLGYRPSRFARGLVKQDTTTIGLIIPDLVNPFFPEVAAGVLAAAEHRGWHVVVCDTQYSPERELAALEVLSHQADAIVGYLSYPDDELERHAGGVPLVLLERPGSSPRLGSVSIDIEGGVLAGMRHLVSSGHNRIGMLDGAPYPSANGRRQHYLSVSHELGLAVDDGWVFDCDHSVEGGASAMEALLGAHPDVTAVFAFNDLVAVGAVQAARGLGRQVPADCAVIGFDGLQLGELVDPPLTTLHIDKRRIGELAVEQVALILSEQTNAATHWPVVRPRLVIRRSA
ncbi:LacI family DNA-binding transcriptional regulator [Kutzneria sp. NPDC051319]|uniref:LacI family DNA-binding transcriptional regulator n=1 Tax=Kutzneria sp. NPDC051319 TaxID=3155047 RepID=UPI00341E4F21